MMRRLVWQRESNRIRGADGAASCYLHNTTLPLIEVLIDNVVAERLTPGRLVE